MILRTRIAALSLPAFAISALAIIAALCFQPEVGAAQCIQSCFAKQDACYFECDSTYHSIDGDSVGTCYSHCDRELDPCFYWSYECEYSENPTCYTYFVQDLYWCEDYPTCAPAYRHLLDHEFQMYESGDMFCW